MSRPRQAVCLRLVSAEALAAAGPQERADAVARAFEVVHHPRARAPARRPAPARRQQLR